MNAKNGFGGYTGDVIFAGTLTEWAFTLGQLGSDQLSAGSVRIHCHGFDLPV